METKEFIFNEDKLLKEREKFIEWINQLKLEMNYEN